MLVSNTRQLDERKEKQQIGVLTRKILRYLPEVVPSEYLRGISASLHLDRDVFFYWANSSTENQFLIAKVGEEMSARRSLFTEITALLRRESDLKAHAKTTTGAVITGNDAKPSAQGVVRGADAELSQCDHGSTYVRVTALYNKAHVTPPRKKQTGPRAPTSDHPRAARVLFPKIEGLQASPAHSTEPPETKSGTCSPMKCC